MLSDQKEDWDHLLTTMKPRGIHHEAWTETEESKHQPDDPVSSGPRPALPTGPCHSQGIPQHTSEIPHGTSRKLTEKTQAFYHQKGAATQQQTICVSAVIFSTRNRKREV